MVANYFKGQWEIFGTLMNGGTLLIRSSDWKSVLKRVSLPLFHKQTSLTRSQVHTVISTPSILGTFPREEYPNIKVVALAGEPCPKP